MQNPFFFITLPEINIQSRIMYVKEITEPNEPERQSLTRLIGTLSSRCTLTAANLEQLLQDKNSHLYGLYDQEQLIGCCCLGFYHSITGKKACLEDVVVLPEHQGKGGGRLLVAHATAEAEKQQAGQLMFTSKPSRVNANRLYQKMNFTQKETNVYIKKW